MNIKIYKSICEINSNDIKTLCATKSINFFDKNINNLDTEINEIKKTFGKIKIETVLKMIVLI